MESGLRSGLWLLAEAAQWRQGVGSGEHHDPTPWESLPPRQTQMAVTQRPTHLVGEGLQVRCGQQLPFRLCAGP